MSDFKVTPIPRHLGISLSHADSFHVIMALYVASRDLEVTDEVVEFTRTLAAAYISNGGELGETVTAWMMSGGNPIQEDNGGDSAVAG